MQKELIKKAQNTFILQKDQSDCGVACLLSLVRYYDGESSLEKLRQLSGTTIQGTTMLGLYQAATEIGFEAEGNEADIEALIEHGKPVILHCLIENMLEHYIICYDYFENKGFLIGDPTNGVSFVRTKELEQIWQSKVCLTLEVTPKLVSKKETQKSKKEWFISLLIDDKKLLLFSLFLGVGFATLNLAIALFSQKLIDDILPSKKMEKLIGGIILLSLLLVIRTGFSAMRGYVLSMQSRDFNNRIIQYFYSNLLQLPKPFFDTRKIGELTARLNDTNRIQRVIQYIISNSIVDFLIVIISTGFLFYYSWLIGLITLLIMPVYYLLIYQYNQKIITAQKQVMQNYALSEANYISTMQGIAEIKNYNLQNFFQSLNQKIYGKFQDKVFNLSLVNIRISFYSGIAGVVFLICIISIASSMVLKNKMDLGILMAILGIIGGILPSITSLALVSIPINEAKIAFNRMFEFTSMEKENDGSLDLENLSSIELKNLSFRFPGRKQLLSDINIKIEHHKIVALVGESGSGKSTIGQILQKFYYPESGQVVVNDQYDLDCISNESWRRNIGIIPQDIKLFNGSILDNILLGKESSIEKIQEFINQYEFNHFISSLPQGLNTLVGEEGVNLSGGQKQVLGFMRVLFHSPKILIMDEPTSSMDRGTENFIFQLLNKLKNQMGIFFISHKLDSLKNFTDTIYVLENYSIITSGNHDELMKTSNFYSNYFTNKTV
ncbi:MAG: peptidase domain-containing ABC transporter [Moheibacter sp.]